MRWFVWGLLAGFTFAPAPPPEACRDELWIIEDPRGLHLICPVGAEMQIEGHGVRCICGGGGYTRLVRE